MKQSDVYRGASYWKQWAFWGRLALCCGLTALVYSYDPVAAIATGYFYMPLLTPSRIWVWRKSLLIVGHQRTSFHRFERIQEFYISDSTDLVTIYLVKANKSKPVAVQTEIRKGPELERFLADMSVREVEWSRFPLSATP